MRRRRLMRAARRLAFLVISLELLYVLVANAVLFSGVIQRAATSPTGLIELDWQRAYSPWPGRVYLSGFRLALEDSVVQFRLTIDSAKVDVVLWELLRRRFRAAYTQADGATFRLVLKVEDTAGREQRVAAFPPIEGFARPPLQPRPPPPELSEDEVDALWRVQLDEVDAVLTELWFLELRYRGSAHVRGGFGLDPVRRLWVGPASAELAPGTLDVGARRVAPDFASRVAFTFAPVDLRAIRGAALFESMSGTIRFDTDVEDLGVAELYATGLSVRGRGRASVDLQVSSGQLLPGTSVQAGLTDVVVQANTIVFTGAAQVRAMVDTTPRLHVDATGAVSAPLEGGRVVAELSGLQADAVATSDQLAEAPGLERLSAVLREARVRDVHLLSRAVGRSVPVFAPIVFGDGPLTASATACVTPDEVLLRLEHLQLGQAALDGAAVHDAKGWRGAAAGHFGAIPLGLRLRDGTVAPALFIPGPWLGAALREAGIAPSAGQNDCPLHQIDGPEPQARRAP